MSHLGRIVVETSPGDLFDRIGILEIKAARIDDPAKRANVAHELGVLTATRDASVRPSVALDRLAARLKEVNELLWEIEDDIRDCERAQDFGPYFIELARAVYRTNDDRAAIKREINDLLGAEIVEEKSYTDY